MSSIMPEEHMPVMMAEQKERECPMVDMDDTQRINQRYGPPDRREQSAWQNPTTWISLMSLLLALCIAVGSMVASRLAIISAKLDALTIESTHDHDTVAQLVRDRDKTERVESDQNAYNFEMSKALTTVITELRIRGYDVGVAVPPAPIQVQQQREKGK